MSPTWARLSDLAAQVKPAMNAAAASAQADHRARRAFQIARDIKALDPDSLTHAAAGAAIASPMTPQGQNGWLDPHSLASSLALTWALTRAIEAATHIQDLALPFSESSVVKNPYPLAVPIAYSLQPTASPILFRAPAASADPSAPWRAALESFIGKRTITADVMEDWLGAIDWAAATGLIPSLDSAVQQAYGSVFTLVREADAAIAGHVDQLVARAVAGQISPNDFIQDLDDVYKTLGLAPQEGWYAELVVNNSMNRAWQEGLDSVSHEIDPATGARTPASWVWGYQWQHGDGVTHPRPTHAAMDGHRAPAADPVWQTFTPPPIAHNCHCARYTIGITEAIHEGYLDKNEKPTSKSFAPPTVTAQDLRAAGLSDKEVKALAGASVLDAFHKLPGDKFPRSHFDNPNRPLINPSGKAGESLSLEARAKLAAHPYVSDLLGDT